MDNQIPEMIQNPCVTQDLGDIIIKWRLLKDQSQGADQGKI